MLVKFSPSFLKRIPPEQNEFLKYFLNRTMGMKDFDHQQDLIIIIGLTFLRPTEK
jgi:hypothetical protein